MAKETDTSLMSWWRVTYIWVLIGAQKYMVSTFPQLSPETRTNISRVVL